MSQCLLQCVYLMSLIADMLCTGINEKIPFVKPAPIDEEAAKKKQKSKGDDVTGVAEGVAKANIAS